MNILINTLGGFVHSLRLHYLEFFGTFYQGGGREFTPFREERKYTKTR
jgi:V/A-type H+-transporting ATPase subunit I